LWAFWSSLQTLLARNRFYWQSSLAGFTKQGKLLTASLTVAVQRAFM
jgi:hypothetical protein